VITFEHVTKQYPDGTVAVDGLKLDVPDGKTMILVAAGRQSTKHGKASTHHEQPSGQHARLTGCRPASQ
jgi:ABC-type ATPase involved in cell division